MATLHSDTQCIRKLPFVQEQCLHTKNCTQARPAHGLQVETVSANWHLLSSNVYCEVL